MPVTLSPSGYFLRGGRHVLPVGVNYWPASCGVEMWAQWPEEEIKADLDCVASLGLNCVRFFLRWPDFEPRLGVYNPVMFDRLRALTGWCAERGLLAHPALVTGFMSGGHFWPEGKGSRNLYSDPEISARACQFCHHAAEALAPFHGHILALDLGNELGCADAWGAASPDAIRDWCGRVTRAIRSAYPGALIVSGTDSGIVTNDSGWRLGAQPGTDFYSVHTYPVPNWNVIPFDGMADPLCRDILPYCTLAARSFGPVMAQEFSTIITHGIDRASAYLQHVLNECFANGANGFLWWCLRDVTTTAHPYERCPFETRLGLVDAGRRVKPQTRHLLDLLLRLRDTPPPKQNPCGIALYLPREYYHRDNPRNPGNDTPSLARRNTVAYHFLRQLGHRPSIHRADTPFAPETKTLVIAGAALTRTEIDALLPWVEAGGKLVWSAPPWPVWSAAADTLIGAQPVDIRFAKPVTVRAFGEDWTIRHHPAEGRTAAQLLAAKPLALGDDGEAEILLNDCGKGRVVTILPLAEETIAHTAHDLPARNRWRNWYAGLLNALEGGCPQPP